jgi:hypothetical protein
MGVAVGKGRFLVCGFFSSLGIIANLSQQQKLML